MLKSIPEKGFAWSPKLYVVGLSFDNPIKYPFLAQEWTEGSSMDWTDSTPERKTREKVLRQVAEIQQSLLFLTLETSTTGHLLVHQRDR